MARILPHYSLCPLIEQDSFLGLTKDVDNDTALVTVNANVISRYRISDPKLLRSWYSKGNITSNCVYDATNDRYVAIFNENEVRIWTATDEFIDKLKKYKFAGRLLKLLICPRTGNVILVYRSGNVFYLDSVLENRESSPKHRFVATDDVILSCDVYLSNTVRVAFVVQRPDSTYRIVSASPDQKEPVFSKSFRSSENEALLGHCLLVEKNCHLVTMWSNGKLYRDLLHRDADLEIRNHFTSLEDLDLKRNVVIRMLSPHHLTICGAKDDGVLLIIYSTKYNQVLCQQYYQTSKMLTQVWIFESRLFLILGHNLVVAQCVEENRKLSTLIGSNVHVECMETLPDAEICKNIVSALLQSNDIEGISNMFNRHTDIPDSVLIDVLFWCLQNESERKEILDKILCDYVINDICRLRSVFNVDLAFKFLDRVLTSLCNSNVDVHLVKWASLFVDAFYPQFITLNDTAIGEKLYLYVNVLKKQSEGLVNYKQLMTSLSCVEREKIIFV